ncbi:uncharacterized protein MELLADRAFT_38748, partial [Melampsora larici-populina 98AG31]
YFLSFDRDKMNLHISQSNNTRTKLAQIAWVPCNIVSPQANKPLMGALPLS